MGKYVAETADGLRYEMDEEPRKIGPTLVYTMFVYDESDSPLARMNRGRYCCERVDLFLHPDQAVLVRENDAVTESSVIRQEDLRGLVPEEVFHLILEQVVEDGSDG